MQLNEARFEMYNRCGYVLQPRCLREAAYHPYTKGNVPGVDPLIINIQVSVLLCATDTTKACQYTYNSWKSLRTGHKVLKFFLRINYFVQIIGARHLPKTGRGLTCPFIEVEIIGCEYDDDKVKTAKKGERGSW